MAENLEGQNLNDKHHRCLSCSAVVVFCIPAKANALHQVCAYSTGIFPCVRAVFIGFYAQGQLFVVNIYTLLLDIVDGFSLEVYLLDPVIFICGALYLSSLFIVGRGLFCGWLCPFGALQEMMGILAEKLRIKQLELSHSTTNGHKKLNMGCL